MTTSITWCLPAHAAPVGDPPHIVEQDGSGSQTFFTPSRIVDTRVGLGLDGPVPAHARVDVPVYAGHDGSDVDIHVTAVDPQAGGNLIIDGDSVTNLPHVTDLDFVRGVTTSNTIVVPVPTNGDDGLSLLNNSSAPLNVTVDEVGFTSGGSGLVSGSFRGVNPSRMLDISGGVGVRAGQVPAGGTVTFDADATPAFEDEPVPAVGAVVFNLAVVDPGDGGYVTAYAAGSSRPPTSSVNFGPGRTTDNFVIVPMDATGRVSIYNGSHAPLDLTADVAGYYRAVVDAPMQAGTYQQVPGARVVDTRSNLGSAAIPARGTARIVLRGRAGISATRAQAVAVNLSAPSAAGNGYLTAWRADTPRPATANLSFTAGTTSTNLALVPLSGDGAIDVYNGSSHPLQLVVDVSGYFLGALPRPTNTSTWTTLTLQQPRQSRLTFRSLSCVGSGFCAAISNRTVDTFAPDRNLAHYQLHATNAFPTGGQISCASADFCAAFTSSGQSFVFDGDHWSAPLTTGMQYAPYLLSCAAPDFCLGIGQSGAAVLHGTTWTAAPIPPDPNVDHLSCASPTFCMGIGADGTATQFDGSSWRAPVFIDGAARFGAGPVSVSCPTTAFCMAMDGGGNQIVYRDGAWAPPVNVFWGGFTALSCTSATFCAGLGGKAEATYLGGTTWTTIGEISADDAQVDGVSCISSSVCVSLDLSGRANIGHISSARQQP